MRWRMNEILDVELGGGCFDLLCWSVGAGLLECGEWLADVFGEGPCQNEEIRMWRGPVISGSAGNLRKDPARKRKLEKWRDPVV